MKIRPVSDLRNNYPLIENELKKEGVVYLTKNGYASAVILGVDQYAALSGCTDKPVARKESSVSSRGFLKKYANPELIDLEKNAGRMHAAKKYQAMNSEVK